MKDVNHFGGGDTAGCQNLGQAGHESQGRVVWRGRRLVHLLGVGFEVAKHDVGKGAADINGYSIGSHILPGPSVGRYRAPGGFSRSSVGMSNNIGQYINKLSADWTTPFDTAAEAVG